MRLQSHSTHSSTIAAARELLRELVQEGVESVPPAPPREPSVALDPRPTAPAPVQAPLLDGHPWGPETSLEEVRSVLGDCTRCGLADGRTPIVLMGYYNPIYSYNKFLV